MSRKRPKVYNADEALELYQELYFADDVSENGDFDGGQPMDISFDSESDSESDRQSKPDGPTPGANAETGDGDDGDAPLIDGAEDKEAEAEGDDQDPDSGVLDAAWLTAFDQRVGSLLRQPDPEATGYELFSNFLTDDIIHHLEVETNRYADHYFQSHGGKENLSPHARARLWKPVNSSDIRAVIAVILYTGLLRLPNYPMYWSLHALLDIGIRKAISRNKFMRIMSFLHASNNEDMPAVDDPDRDRLFKIRPMLDMFIERWQSAYYPRMELSLDETIIPFKGRSHFVKYQPNKPHKWGFVMWSLCDAKAGYVVNWKMSGDRYRTNYDEEKGVMHNVVMDLLSPYLDVGHHVYMDNLFTSPHLFEELADRATGACGTLRKNRRGVPDVIKNAKPKKGEPPVCVKDEDKQYITWQDKKQVNLLTTVHNTAMYEKTIRQKRGEVIIQKPKAVQQYNNYMGGVDLSDQLMWHCLNIHKCTKWWKRILIALLEVSVCNTVTLLRQMKPAEQRKKVDANAVRLEIITGLLAGYNCSQPRVGKRLVQDQHPGRIIGGHFCSPNPKRLSSGRRSSQDCIVCSVRPANRHQTSNVCRPCGNVPLCVFPCFKRFHTFTKYKVVCSPELHDPQ